jgi:hypothetical protein
VTDGGSVVEIYWNLYFEQSQGSELITRDSRLFDPAQFATDLSEIVEFNDSEGRLMQAQREIWTDSIGTSWLAVYTYFVDGEPIASSSRVQLTTATRSLLAQTTAGIVAAATPCADECGLHIADVKAAFIRAVSDYRQEAESVKTNLLP